MAQQAEILVGEPIDVNVPKNFRRVRTPSGPPSIQGWMPTDARA